MNCPTNLEAAVTETGSDARVRVIPSNRSETVITDNVIATQVTDAPPHDPCAAAAKDTDTGFDSAIADLELMAKKSEQWVGNELAASWRRLYAILTDCYRYYLRMKTDADVQVRNDLTKALEKFIEVKNYGTKGATHDMNRIVRAVFGDDRRRVSAYGIALRSALKAGGNDESGKAQPLAPELLVDWLVKCGGVEAVRLRGKKTLSSTKPAEIAKRAVHNRAITIFKPDPRAIDMNTSDINTMMVLIATYRSTGAFEINAVVRRESAVNAALTAHYSANKKIVRAAAEATADPKMHSSAMELALSTLPAAA